MPFMIETWDKPDSGELRQRVRPTHLEYLVQHQALLLACGAKLDDTGTSANGSFYIVAVASRSEAESFIAADPFALAGLFTRVEICRWRKSFLDGKSYL